MWVKLKALAIFLAPALFFGMAVGAYPGYRVFKFVWEDSRFCFSCHVHDYATYGWEKSVHGQTTTCHDCHHQPLHAYIVEAYLMARHQPKFPKDLHHTPYVPKDLCAACHLSTAEDKSTITGPMIFEDVEKIPKVDFSYLHKLHLGKTTKLELLNTIELTDQERMEHPVPPLELPTEKGEERSITCADCHGGPTNRGHNFSAVDKSCVRCHQTVHETKFLREYGCRSCHFQEFLAPVVSEQILRKKPKK